MAWNVVIAGGGFAGSTCARTLERLLPKQSARLAGTVPVNSTPGTARGSRISRGNTSTGC